MAKEKELIKSITNDGLGEKSGKTLFYMSEPADLLIIKAKAKSMGLSVNELFNAAAITAASKLELPQKHFANRFNTHNIVTMHDNGTVVKLGTW